MKKSIVWSCVLVMAVFILIPACATKKFVNTEVSSVDKKVASISASRNENR